MLRDDVEKYFDHKSDNSLIDKVKSMREEDMSVDEIAASNNISIREVVDILNL